MRGMKKPRIIFGRFEKYISDTLAPTMSFLYVYKLEKRRHKATRFGFLLVSILSLAACQPSLWGAPPPPPTLAASATVTAVPLTATATI